MPVQIATTDHEIKRAGGPGRKSQPNPFADAIASFDDGLTRKVTLTAGEKCSTVLSKLRAAAKGIERSVSIELIFPEGSDSDKVGDAVGFYFKLGKLITRQRKEKTEVADVIATEATKQAAKKTAKK